MLFYFISYIVATIICICIVIVVIVIIVIVIVNYYYETGDYPPSYFLFILNLLCYKTISADNSIWISTLYKYGILFYLFILFCIFTTNDSKEKV